MKTTVNMQFNSTAYHFIQRSVKYYSLNTVVKIMNHEDQCYTMHCEKLLT
jgi:hypothetical protein